MALEVAKSYKELLAEAKKAEASEDLDKAARNYEKAVRLEPHEEYPYTRLMVIYRKKKDYESELKIIRKGIAAFEAFHEKRAKRVFRKDQKALKLSNSLAKSLGQIDKKGNPVALPEPVASWSKRAKLVEKKLGL